MRIAVLVTLLSLLTAASATSQRWQLEFEPGGIGTVTARGAEGPGNYLYMTFTVTNRSGQDVPLRLSLDVATEVPGRAYRAGFDPLIFKLVEKYVVGRSLPKLADTRQVLADGDSVECLVTFGKVDPQVGRFDISVHGLMDRVYRDSYQWWVEDRVLTLKYHRPGDEHRRQEDPVLFDGRSWRVLSPRKPLRRG